MRPRVAVLALAVLMVAGGPAFAHRLKLFAAVAGNEVSGYGFFIGGGRPAGVPIVARNAEGAEVWRGNTGEDGGFAFTVAQPEALTLVLDAGDGHAVEETLTADRFASTAPPAEPIPPISATSDATRNAATPSVGVDPLTPEIEARIAARVATSVAAEVDKAVARQIRPLLEAQAAAEGRIRVNDVLGGLGWIAGLVGVALFFTRRRKA
jgi:nickel transport protein